MNGCECYTDTYKEGFDQHISIRCTQHGIVGNLKIFYADLPEMGPREIERRVLNVWSMHTKEQELLETAAPLHQLPVHLL